MGDKLLLGREAGWSKPVLSVHSQHRGIFSALLSQPDAPPGLMQPHDGRTINAPRKSPTSRASRPSIPLRAARDRTAEAPVRLVDMVDSHYDLALFPPRAEQGTRRANTIAASDNRDSQIRFPVYARSFTHFMTRLHYAPPKGRQPHRDHRKSKQAQGHSSQQQPPGSRPAWKDSQPLN